MLDVQIRSNLVLFLSSVGVNVPKTSISHVQPTLFLVARYW